MSCSTSRGAGERIYGCIDGVGPETPSGSTMPTPTVAAVLDTSREELTTVDGVGPERADAIYAALRDG